MIFIWDEPVARVSPDFGRVAHGENGPVRLLGRLDVWQEEGLCADVEQMLDQDRVEI